MDPSIWIKVFLGFLIVEFLTVNLVTIWFAGGALVAALAASLGAPEWGQVIIFIAASIALLVPLKPWADKKFNKTRTKTNVNAVVGKTGVVIESIDTALNKGRVMLQGMEWSAKTEEESGKIPRGASVTVLRVEGVKLVVTIMEEKE